MRSRRGRFRGTESADRRTHEPVLLAGREIDRILGRTRGIVVQRRWPTECQAARSRRQPGFNGAWWSADNTIIYSTARRLQRVSAGGGGTPEPLMAGRANGGVAAPVLLPGGHAVLFHAFDAGDRVAVLDLDTGQEKTVVDGGSNPTYVDTGHLVFARGDTLMAVPFKVSELAVTGEPVALIQGVRRASGGAADYALSANGTLVYVPGTAEAVSNAAVVWVDRARQGHRPRRARPCREPARPAPLARRQAATARDRAVK